MPSIALGSDEPIDAVSPPAAAPQPRQSSNEGETPVFEDKLKALSNRLQNKSTQQQQLPSVDDILRSGTVVVPFSVSSTTAATAEQQHQHFDPSSISELAGEILEEFAEIEGYNYDLDEEIQAKRQLEEAKHREMLEMKKRREEERNQKRNNNDSKNKSLYQDASSTNNNNNNNNDDARSEAPTFVSMKSGFSIASSSAAATTAIRREELYEVPAAVANYGGAMKRRLAGTRPTAGYTKMFTNDGGANDGFSAAAGKGPLMQRIPQSTFSTKKINGSSSIARSTNSSRPQFSTSRSISTSSMIQERQQQQNDPSSINMMVMNRSPQLPQAHGVGGQQEDEDEGEKANNNNSNNDNNSEDDEDEEESAFVIDDGMIKFCCTCGKICTRSQKKFHRRQFECLQCNKFFGDDDDDHKAQAVTTSTTTVTDVQAETDDAEQLQRQEKQRAQHQQELLRLQQQQGEDAGNGDDDTGEAEQRRLFQIAVQLWRGGGGGAADNANSGGVDDSSLQNSPEEREAENEADLRFPDTSRFMYFSHLWEKAQALEVEE